MNMTSKVMLPSLRNVAKRHLTAQASAQQSSASASYILSKQEAKTTTLPNGLIVTSLENYSPITRVALLFRAGSRYETADCIGATHTLRASAGLSNKQHTSFAIARNVQQIGGSINCTTDRDYLMYDIDCLRRNIDTGLEFLTSVATKQGFLPWELKDNAPMLALDLALLTPQAKLLDDLHKAAYRSSGLGNSLFVPCHLVGALSPETLSKFVADNLTSHRAAVVGTGIDHDHLLSYAQSVTLTSGEGSPAVSKFGGGELRTETGGSLTYVAVAGEGTSLKKGKDVVTQSLLQYVLGVDVPTKRGTGCGRLKSAAAATGETCSVSGLSTIYQDSSLCGFYLVTEAAGAGKVVSALVKEMKSLTATDADLSRAKNQLKAALLRSHESSASCLEDLGVQSLLNGRVETIDTILKTVDSVSVADVNALSKKIISGKLTMSSRGSLHSVPYLDEL